MANKTVDSDAAFKTYVEGLPAYASGTVYMNDDSKYWTFNKQATDKINAMCVNGDDIEVWVYDGTDWITNKIPEVVDNLTSTSVIDALSANQGKVLDEKINTLSNSIIQTGKWTPHIYDYNTDLGGLNAHDYFIIGNKIAIFTISQTLSQAYTTSQMLQIRGFPISVLILGGTFYCATATGQGGAMTIQAADNSVYIRPNFIGTLQSGSWFTGMFIGMIR